MAAAMGVVTQKDRIVGLKIVQEAGTATARRAGSIQVDVMRFKFC